LVSGRRPNEAGTTDTEGTWGLAEKNRIDELNKSAYGRIYSADRYGYGVGVVLGQTQWVDGKRRDVVIAYGSKHLTYTQSRWSTLDKELYAIIYALE
jgi:hypothetical protein